jgi:hypothetical protein
MDDYAKIWAEAEAAGFKAMQDFSAKCTRDVKNGMYMGGSAGMAWLIVRPARGKFVAWCKKENAEETARMTKERGRDWKCNPRGDNHYKSGWLFWRPGSSGYSGQSIDMYEVAARAFAAVLEKHGIPTSFGSRMD